MLRNRSSLVVLSVAFGALFTSMNLQGQSQRILQEVKVAKAENKKEITIAGTRLDYFRLAGTFEQVIQKHSALLIRTKKVARHAEWADIGQIFTWHTFTIESRLVTPPQKVAEPAHDPAHGHPGCRERRRKLGFDRLRLRGNEVALYFPGGSLPIDGVVVHASGWQTIWPVAKGRYLVFGELCDDARSIELAYGPESWFQVSAHGAITPVVETPFSAEIARLGTIRNLRARIGNFSK